MSAKGVQAPFVSRILLRRSKKIKEGNLLIAVNKIRVVFVDAVVSQVTKLRLLTCQIFVVVLFSCEPD